VFGWGSELSDEVITPEHAASYLAQYITAYRAYYQHLVLPPPGGSGYPPLVVSPYLLTIHFSCYLARDGAVVVAGPHDVSEKWPDPRTESVLVNATPNLSEDYAQGIIPPATAEARSGLPDGTTIQVGVHDIQWSELILRLTMGSMDFSGNYARAPFWFPNVIAAVGFAAERTKLCRYLIRLEAIHHIDEAAWDLRAIPVRVEHDVRRDFAGVVRPEEFNQRLVALGHAIAHFAHLLRAQHGADESVFHDFVRNNPLLLDVYGTLVSKPRWRYPQGESPLGKEYVEPDFVIVYPGNRYRLVELERPEKPLATKAGHPRAELAQATFQIAEWRDYIARHYNLIKDTWPDISPNSPASVVISRQTEESLVGDRSPARYAALLGFHHPNLEVFTYDDLLVRASQMYARITALAPTT
jgi:hypothetical protein